MHLIMNIWLKPGSEKTRKKKIRWIFQESYKCALSCIPPDHGRHHHLLHHLAYGDSLEGNYRGEFCPLVHYGTIVNTNRTNLMVSIVLWIDAQKLCWMAYTGRNEFSAIINGNQIETNKNNCFSKTGWW